MSPAVGLALLAGFAWAVNMVALRWGMSRTGVSNLVGAFVAITTSALVAAGLALVVSPDATGLSWPSVWRFGLVGAIAPGSSQGLFLASIRRLGTSRTGVLVGTAPMFSVVMAIVLLDEGWQTMLIAGTVLTVLGGVLLAWERGERFVLIGSAIAVLTAISFAIRDIVARKFTTDLDVEVVWAAVVVLVGASLVLGAMSLVSERTAIGDQLRRAVPEMFASGLCVGVALPVLLLAFERGRVGVVAPLSNGAQTITIVVLGAVLYGANERTNRVLVAVALVLAGGTLISIFR